MSIIAITICCFFRLMLGKYSVGESRGFLHHEGQLGQLGTPVRVVECPPIRDENWRDYYTHMEATLGQLAGTVHSVLLLVKYSPIGFGGFRLDREKNIPEEELLVLRSILGDGLRGCVSLVVTNWSRQFARISERRLRGVTENQVEKKLQEEVAYSLGFQGCSVYFMDTVFWRTEQKVAHVPNTLPTTLDMLRILLVKILDNVYLEEPGAPPSMGQPPDLVQTGHHVANEVNSSTSEDEDGSNRLARSRWKNYQNLTDDMEPRGGERGFQFSPQGMSRSSSSSSLSEAHQAIPIPVRVVQPTAIHRTSQLTPGRGSRVELSDYIEAKVRQMMDKEGVILDFSDSRLRGKIVTTTKIIKEVTARDGTKKIIEDEEVDEEHFGSELESISGQSLHQYDTTAARAEPIFSMGAPVVSTTFDRRQVQEPPAKAWQQKPEENYQEPYSEAREKSLPSQSSSSSSLSDGGETIEVVHEVLDEGGDEEAAADLASLTASVVILGQEPNLSHIKAFLREQRVANIFTCEVQANHHGPSPYRQLTGSLPPAADIIFIWTVETETGEISDDLVWMFGDFIEAFSAKAIEHMIVLLWHPGSPEDIRGSLQDVMTPVNNFEYRSSLGFAVLQFRPIRKFYARLSKKIAAANTFQWEKPSLPEEAVGKNTEDVSRGDGVGGGGGGMEDSSLVDSPVIVLVSPPGHGKSSIGNMLLGPGHFQVGNLSCRIYYPFLWLFRFY